jgi:hypothetical protein
MFQLDIYSRSDSRALWSQRNFYAFAATMWLLIKPQTRRTTGVYTDGVTTEGPLCSNWNTYSRFDSRINAS